MPRLFCFGSGLGACALCLWLGVGAGCCLPAAGAVRYSFVGCLTMNL